MNKHQNTNGKTSPPQSDEAGHKPKCPKQNGKSSSKKTWDDSSSGSGSHHSFKNTSKSKRVDLKEVVKAAVVNYRSTDMYQRGCSAGFKTQAALDRFNDWVRANLDTIDPSKIPVCGECGSCDLLLCNHFVVPVSVNTEHNGVLVVQAPIKTKFYFQFHFIDGIKKMLLWPEFDLKKQNNTLAGGFDNADIDDENLIPELYNHIKLKLQTSYMVNGKDDRALRLAHAQRIAHKWIDMKKINPDDDTLLTNRIMFTIQRTCDNAESAVLYKKTDPTKNFLLARLSDLKSLVRSLVFLLAYLVLSRFLLLSLPTIIALATEYILPGAVNTWLSLFVSTCQALLRGSQLVCWGLVVYPFSGIGVPVMIITALLTFLWSIKQKQ